MSSSLTSASREYLTMFISLYVNSSGRVNFITVFFLVELLPVIVVIGSELANTVNVYLSPSLMFVVSDSISALKYFNAILFVTVFVSICSLSP